MRHLRALAALALLSLAWIPAALGQAAVVTTCGTLASPLPVGSLGQPLYLDIAGKLCTAASVSVSGFTPSASGARGTPLTVTTSDSTGTLPTGAVIVVTNVGTANPMYCNVNGIAATTSDQLITANGGQFAFTKPSGATALHCIATGGSTTANMLGGDGLPGGATGGGGGGSSITSWAGSVLGAISAYGTSPGAVTVPAFNAFVTNATSPGRAAPSASSPVVLPATPYETVAASQTGQALGATGATGDYLSHCVIYPVTTSPGVVTVFDNTNAAGTNVIAFAGGASSVSNLAPIPIPVGAISTAGAWKVTTGTNVIVTCYGNFT